MALVTIPWHPSAKDLRIFAALQWVFFSIIAASLCSQSHACGFAALLELISIALAVTGWIRPALIRWVYVGWLLAVFPMGWVVSHLVLAIAYFGVLTPIGWLLRRRGYDPLQRRFDPMASSYWTTRPDPPEKSRYFRQF